MLIFSETKLWFRCVALKTMQFSVYMKQILNQNESPAFWYETFYIRSCLQNWIDSKMNGTYLLSKPHHLMNYILVCCTNVVPFHNCILYQCNNFYFINSNCDDLFVDSNDKLFCLFYFEDVKYNFTNKL